MTFLFFNLVFAFFLLVFLCCFSFRLIAAIYSEAAGVPCLATSPGEIERILKEADLKPGQVFYDLGCGDGRVVRSAVGQYRVQGRGVDANPLLVFWARFLAKIQNVKNTSWQTGDLLNADLSLAGAVYFFLNPKLLQKLTPKLEKELKKGVLIISHGFEVRGFAGSLVKKIDGGKFPTYFYRIT